MGSGSSVERGAGSPEAGGPSFVEIYQAESSYMWNTLRRFGVRERDLEDVVHDAFVAVYRSLDAYDASRPLRPWLCGVAFHVASDYRRSARHKREIVADVSDDGADEAPLADELMSAEQARHLVALALDGVRLERRAVFVMHDVDGFSVPEIARSLAIPINTAYSRLRLARQEFRAAVRRIQLERGAA